MRHIKELHGNHPDSKTVPGDFMCVIQIFDITKYAVIRSCSGKIWIFRTFRKDKTILVQLRILFYLKQIADLIFFVGAPICIKGFFQFLQMGA